ncbi:MAG: CHAT domain-containing protein [Gemmataceae bacterium]|nr:CHAT domain-containing protein [Gemmataceae bacterium]
MTRIALVLGAVLLGAGLRAADDPPPKKELTPEERKELKARWASATAASVKAYRAGELNDAEKAADEALRLAGELYPASDYPDGHDDIVVNIINIANIQSGKGNLRLAERLHRSALAMTKRLHPGDHDDVARGLTHLALFYVSHDEFKAAKPLLVDALAMQRRLHEGSDHPNVVIALKNLVALHEDQNQHAAAEPLLVEVLAIQRRLHKGADHPDVARTMLRLAESVVDHNPGAAERLTGDALTMLRRIHGEADHPDVAKALFNLSALCSRKGMPELAEVGMVDALAMRRRLSRGADHRDVAVSLGALANVYMSLGRLAAAEPLLKDALAMWQRLQPGGGPAAAALLGGLGSLYLQLGRLAAAERPLADSLAMWRRLHDNGDHPSVAGALSNLANLRHEQGKYATAERLYVDAIEMMTRLGNTESKFLGAALNGLGRLYVERGRPDTAEPLLREAVAIEQRLHPGEDHLDRARNLGNLACALQAQGKTAEAERHFRDAMDMQVRLATAYAEVGAEGHALTLAAAFPLSRDAFVSAARTNRSAPAGVYAGVWSSKSSLARVYVWRALRARSEDASALASISRDVLAIARERRAELMLAPKPTDPAARKERDKELAEMDETVRKFGFWLPQLMPAVNRVAKLAGASSADLQKALPAGTAVVDFIAYTHTVYDPTNPGVKGVTQTPSYTAFVVTKDKVAWVDLGPAGPIEEAVGLWRQAITAGKDIPPDLPARVRTLVWDKVRAELPAGTKTVYVVPDAALTGLPWAALPGDKPGTILLEDYAVATLPHAPYLLDKLWPDNPRPNRPAGLLAVGGVGFDSDPPRPSLWAAARAAATPRNRDAAVKEGAKLEWQPLPGTAAEADGVASLAKVRKIDARLLTGREASADAILAELTKARYAHIATHGFFADPSFRSVLQLDPKLFEMTARGERVGAGANSPMVLSGLVFAGANKPGTPGRGIVTGELLVDRDLSGLELAVLSACETGLGDVAGGEGVFGLTRAFHVAGCRDVVASLWKVDDAATAALMNLFYRNLWEKDLPPIEALRQAQLHVYRNPAAVPDLAQGLRGRFEVVKGSGPAEVAPKPGPDGKAHPRLWAAFVLSGPGTRPDPAR